MLFPHLALLQLCADAELHLSQSAHTYITGPSYSSLKTLFLQQQQKVARNRLPPTQEETTREVSPSERALVGNGFALGGVVFETLETSIMDSQNHRMP